MTTIISPTELLALQNSPDLVLIDVRTGAKIQDRFLQNHLKGALWVDLETDLSHKKGNPADGGRHPLPSISEFATLLGKLGISRTSLVVVYDDKNGANAAARFWWMLRALGHPSVWVLDGGIQAAITAGFSISSTSEKSQKARKYPVKTWQLAQATIEEVEQVAQKPDYCVIDVRDTERYLGRTEPIDLIAGHIPGAINIPFSENLDDNGFFLSPEVLREKYEKHISQLPTHNMIVHCGSGVTACHTLLALAHAGFEIPKLYVGSWSEWSRTERPIATEKETFLQN
jgi:thiosulfate/3-mercaptopyruvate sulfurtransferase